MAGRYPDPRAVLQAAAQIVREERTARRKSDDQLRATIAKLETRVTELEQRRASRPLHAVGE